MATANHVPNRPIDSYPAADLPPMPPEAAPGESAAPATQPPVLKPFEVAALRFLDPGAMSATVALAFPFEWEGEEVHTVTIRRLSTAEVGAVMAAIPDGADYDVFVFIAAMSGLPAPVLRGLIEDDGAEVVAKARPLLPRKVEAALFAPISGPGDPTPSPQLEG